MVLIKVLLFGFINLSNNPEEWVLTLAQVQIRLPASMIGLCKLGGRTTGGGVQLIILEFWFRVTTFKLARNY